MEERWKSSGIPIFVERIEIWLCSDKTTSVEKTGAHCICIHVYSHVTCLFSSLTVPQSIVYTMIVKHSRTAAVGVLFMIIGLSHSSRTSLRGENQRQLQDDSAAEVAGTMDLSAMEGFSDIGTDSLDNKFYNFDGWLLEKPADVMNTTSITHTEKEGGDARIIGGSAAAYSNSYVPNNQVMLLRRTGTNSQGQPTYAPNNCGGTLITNKHVLTAAHCIGRYGANGGVLVNARNPYDTNNNGAPKWKSPVASEMAHPEYGSHGKGYDVGIITLQDPVPDSMLSSLPPARIASSVPSDGSAAVVAGFGRTNANSSAKPQTMQAVQIQKISSSQCQSAYSGIDSSQFCAGNWNGGQDSCQGDSGGGLHAGTSPSSQTLVGVVSWGQGCGLAGNPGVYASVPFFQSWIRSQVCYVSGVNTGSSPICA